MKYTVLGFQQEKLIQNNLSVEDAFILRTIKDMYSSSTMEFKDFDGIKYMWINYTYLLEQIPIIGSKRNLMRKIEVYGKDYLLLRVLRKERQGKKGNYSYVSPTEKLDGLQDFDLMTESHKGYDKTDIRVMTESHNKDTSIKDTSIKDIYGEKVLLTKDEYQKLVSQYGDYDTNQMIEILDNWYLTKGKKPNKSDYHTMVGKGWVLKRLREDQQRQQRDKPIDNEKPKVLW